MYYLMMFIIGVAAGGVCVFVPLLERRKRLGREKNSQDAREQKVAEDAHALKAKQAEMDTRETSLMEKQQEFERKTISYSELESENAILKRDLRNIDVNLRKLELDRGAQQENQQALDERGREMGGRYLKENIRWLSRSLTPNNYAASKQRLLDVIERCRGIGFLISKDEEGQYVADLKKKIRDKSAELAREGPTVRRDRVRLPPRR